MRRVLMKTIVFAAAAAVLVAAWIYAAPQQIGGSAAYVVVVGSSMEPRLHRGDLAVVRSRNGYEAGDVVAYRSSRLGRTVLHRVERRAGDRYVLRGDANTWLDPDRPSEAQVVGQLALRVPVAGGVIEWLRHPLHASLLAGLAAFALLAGAGTAGVRRRTRGKAQAPVVARPRRGVTAAPVVFVVAAPLAAIALAGTLLAYAQPRERAVADTIAYEHHGSFEYAATARPSPAYDGRRISTGQPIFFRLTDKATFTYAYELDTAAAGSIRGSGRLVAQLTDGNGWTRTIAKGPRRTFAGEGVRVRLPLDLRRLRGLVHRIEDATGVTRPTYTVAVVPHVTVRGTLAGTSFSDRFGEPLTFQLDGNQLQLPPSSGIGAAGASALDSTRRGIVRVVDVRRAELSLLGVGVPVGVARVVAPLLALVLLALALAAGALLVRRPQRREEEPAWIGARYRVSLLPAAHRAPRLEESVIELETIEALVQVARERGRAILHERHEAGDSYFFEDGGVVYRHRSGEVPAPPKLVAADASEKPKPAARPRRRAVAK